MSLSIAANVNIDTIKNLDANKTYFLSSTTGEVKEASFWMRFKCAIGVKSARQKVASLVEAVRTSLLDAAGKTGDDAALDTDIKTVNLKSMVKGSVIKDIASRFSAANANSIAKAAAKAVSADVAKTFVGKLHAEHPDMALDDGSVAKIFTHAFQIHEDSDLPMKENMDGERVLDRKIFETALLEIAYEVKHTIEDISGSKRLGQPSIDKHYAKHIVDTLYNKDGTRNERTLADIKTPMQVKVDVAFRLGQNLVDNRAQIVHGVLVGKGIDPQQKLAEILGFCNGDRELEDYVLEVAPSLCVNSNNNLRSNESIQKKISAIRESLDEINSLQKSYPGTAAQLKHSISLIDSTAFPKGTLTKIAEAIETCSFTRLGSLNSRSGRSDIFKAMDELRIAMDVFQKQVNLDKIFADIGEEAGGPHGMAAKNVAMTLILSKLGPGAAARLPHVVSGTQFNIMRAVTTELKAQFRDHDPDVILGDEKTHDKAKDIIGDFDMTIDYFIDTLNYGRERPVNSDGNVACDINDDEGMEMRLYLGDVAREDTLRD